LFADHSGRNASFFHFWDFAPNGVFSEVDSVGQVEVLDLMTGSFQRSKPSLVDVRNGEFGAGFDCKDSHSAENLKVHFDAQVFDAADGEGAWVVPAGDSAGIAGVRQGRVEVDGVED
jgi:hypothetical protein